MPQVYRSVSTEYRLCVAQISLNDMTKVTIYLTIRYFCWRKSERKSMKKNNFTEMFYRNAGYIVVVLISLVYVASSLINISKSGRSVYEIIGSGVLSLIVGIMINGVFRSIGVRRGDEDERTIATNELHAKTVEEISPYIDRLDSFCERENKRVLKEIRTRILAREGMKYSDYFDEEGALVNAKCKVQNTKLIMPSPAGKGDRATVDEESISSRNEKLRRRAYHKALHVKLKPLLSSNLTSDGVRATDPFDFGKSKREYTARRNASDVIIKLLMAIIFGYFGVSLASEINVASIIWNGLQIILYITGGVIQMYNSYMWVVDDYRGSVIKKIDYLQKFKNYCQTCINLGEQPN